MAHKPGQTEILVNAAPAERPVDLLGHGHQASPDGVEAISPQQVEAQAAQYRQRLNAIAFGLVFGATVGVVVGVLAKLPMPKPVPPDYPAPLPDTHVFARALRDVSGSQVHRIDPAYAPIPLSPGSVTFILAGSMAATPIAELLQLPGPLGQLR